jgi:hypothetical protein
MSEAMPPLPNTPSWRGAQLKKHRSNLTFTLPKAQVTKKCPECLLGVTLTGEGSSFDERAKDHFIRNCFKDPNPIFPTWMCNRRILPSLTAAASHVPDDTASGQDGCNTRLRRKQV